MSNELRLMDSSSTLSSWLSSLLHVPSMIPRLSKIHLSFTEESLFTVSWISEAFASACDTSAFNVVDSEIPYNFLACAEETPELSTVVYLISFLSASELAKSHVTDKVALLSSLAFLYCISNKFWMRVFEHCNPSDSVT